MPTDPLDLVTVGSAVIDHIHRVTVLPERDTGVMVLDRQSGPGGVEGNVAAAAARLGLSVGVIVRVGSDAAGAMVLEDFRQRGIDVLRVQVGGEDDTAYTLVFVDGHGDRSMVTGGQGVRGLTLDENDDAYIRRARICFTSGYLPSSLLHRVAGLCAGDQGPALAFDLPGSICAPIRGRSHSPAGLPTYVAKEYDELRSVTGNAASSSLRPTASRTCI